jgi:Flp pilus assembly protein TadG
MASLTGARQPLERRWTRVWRSESGAELIEFALIFPTLLLVVMGIMDLGFLFQRYEVVTNAAREGARVSVLSGVTTNPPYTQSDIEARVSAYMTAAGLTCSSCVSLTPAILVSIGGGHCISTRTVTVTYDSQLMFLGPIFNLMGGGSTKTLRSTSAMRVESAVEACR